MNTTPYIPPADHKPNLQSLTFTAQGWFNNSMSKMFLFY